MGLGSLLSTPTLATDITVAAHPEVHVAGLTINIDIVWATAIACLVIVFMGLVLRAKATSGVPGKFQLIWEMGVEGVSRQVDESIGPEGARIVPLALTLFVLIFTCNLFEVLGIGATYEFLPAPTSDINLPLAMALTVFVLTNVAAIRNRRPGGYVAHYFNQPLLAKSVVGKFFMGIANAFLNVIEEIVKPVTLTLRLFGNLFAGGLMLSLLAALVIWKLGPVPLGGILSVPFTVIWKLFDLLIGAIQAFIFALLTIVYFQTAMASDH